MSEKLREVSDSSFEQEVLGSDQPVLVDFWAAWCAPCWMMSPTVDAVAEQYAGSVRVVKLDVDENPGVAQRYGIKGIPTLLLFRQGKEAERVVGAVSEDVLSHMVEKYCGEAV
jgi:thioredoxin 1